MPTKHPADLAQPNEWCGCKPGNTRVQVLAALQTIGMEAKAYGDDNLTVTEADLEWEFYFTKDGSDRLRQITVEGPELLWAGNPLDGARLDEALRMLGPLREIRWTKSDAAADPYDELMGTAQQTVTDEELLREGTIWLPERGVGLVIWNGAVTGVVWREAQDLPKQFAGPVTAAQEELARRPDLEDILRDKERQQAILTKPKDPLRFLRGALTVATIAGLILTVLDGFKEKELWSKALTVTAKLRQIERGPMKQFFEYLPAPVTGHLPHWLLAGGWSSQQPKTDLYCMEFTDSLGHKREVWLEAAEFYVPPREIGEETDVIVADEGPPLVKGPSRARDAALMEHVPWAITIGLLWLLGQTLLSGVAFIWPRIKRLRIGRAPGIVKVKL